MSSSLPAPPEIVDRQAVHDAGSAVMAMTLFVASEAVFFGAFLGIYASAYADSDVWPPKEVPSPSLVLPTLAAAVLLASAGSMAVARRGTRRTGGLHGAVPWLWATLLGAVAFVALVVAGYPGLGFGIGQGVYESLFYSITGLALAHVAGGIVLLILVLARARSGELALQREPLQVAAIYWYFVVALGLVIYLMLYLAAG